MVRSSYNDNLGSMSLVYQTPAVTSASTATEKNKSHRRPPPRRHGLYVGGSADAKDLTKLQRWNVSHILNMTPTKDSGLQVGVIILFPLTGNAGKTNILSSTHWLAIYIWIVIS
jgi:hypothetical protein